MGITEFTLFAVIAIVICALIYGHYAQSAEIEDLKGRIRFVENANARAARVVNVFHHRPGLDAPAPRGRGIEALVKDKIQQWPAI